MKGLGSGKLRRILGIVLAVVLALTLAACSSSSDDDSDAAPQANEQAVMNAPAEEMSAVDQYGEADGESGAVASSIASVAPAAGSEEPQPTRGEQTGSQSIGGGIGPIANADAGYGRKVIYQANLVMKVENFTTAEEQLSNLIHMTPGAYTLEFADSRNPDEKGATYVVKVPSGGFSSFLDGLKEIKTVHLERNVQGNDVTEEYVDLDARLKAKTTVETRLLGFMDKATKTDDLVRFSNELARVQEEIEQIKGRIRYLDQNVAFSTVSVRLYEAAAETLKAETEEEDQDFGDRIYDALSGSAKVLRQFGEGLLVVLAALLPVLLVASVIGIPTYVIVRRRHAARQARAEARRKEIAAHNLNVAPAKDRIADGANPDDTGDETASDTSPDDRTER
ncbi:DUF4349 domain-containing protein [Cohnella sp. GCM10027633]|uniref:DUF4349 domain-containing protein n=1 Tax=unclassified Cohnella TaxID=2636738 RepID=UPI00362AAAE1